MHILLTDVVTCPRCGPEFGLIVLADHIESRQVVEGSLGCANCREEYPVHSGVADLRRQAASPHPPPEPHSPADEALDAEKPYRLAALLGVTGPAAPVVVASKSPSLVAAVQDHLQDAGVVGLSVDPRPGADSAGIGWLLADAVLPFRTRSLGGVALAAGDPFPLIEEALRCLGRGARLVIDPAPPGTADQLLRHGAELLLEQEEVAVAYDPRAG